MDTDGPSHIVQRYLHAYCFYGKHIAEYSSMTQSKLYAICRSLDQWSRTSVTQSSVWVFFFSIIMLKSGLIDDLLETYSCDCC